ncbi:putative FAD-linked oxidoreductase [Peptococcaceae bacterium CEB3]|nr:putative FAD-linked oxidoreductase [Peptococcaceae bacterium CEB3]
MEVFLKEIFGSRMTTDPFELEQYTKDIAYIPPILVRLLAKPWPRAVVQAEESREIACLMQWAFQKRIPVTVRGGGSSAYFNSVPVQEGIVLDMNHMQGVGAVHMAGKAEEPAVWVQAGTTWYDADERLRRQGYTLRSYPTSAPAATVGGWISLGGFGIGSIRYGPLREQILGVRAVTAGGEIAEVDNPGLKSEAEASAGGGGLCFDDFFGMEGTRAVITEAHLTVRPFPEKEAHRVLAFRDVRPTGRMIQELGQVSSVFNVHFSSPTFVAALHKKGYASELPQERYCLAVDLAGRQTEVEEALRTIRREVQVLGGEVLATEAGEAEWISRFKALRLKQTWPSLQAAELLLPVEHFAAFEEALTKLAKQKHTVVVTYAHLVSPETVLLMVLFPSDELNTLRYLGDLSFISRIYALGKLYGGKPYIIGLWNTSYLSDIYTSKELKRRWERKQRLDRPNILNPGKAYKAPFFLSRSVFRLGMGFLGMLCPFVRAGRESDA